jgi:type I restriction enzyme S subunit
MSEVTEWITQGPNPNLNKEPSNNNFGFIKTKDVYNDAIYYAAINSLNEEEYEKFKKYTLKEGDVLLAIVGFGSIGKVNIFKEVVKRKIIPTRALALIRCKTERILPEYVKGYLLSSEGKKIIENWTGGSTGQLVVKTSVIKNYLIPLPSIIQQKKFKEVLLDIENIKKRQGTSTQEINNLFDALIQKAFKGELIR